VNISYWTNKAKCLLCEFLGKIALVILAILVGYLIHANHTLKNELAQHTKKDMEAKRAIISKLQQVAGETDRNTDFTRFNLSTIKTIQDELRGLQRHGTVEVLIKHKDEK